MSQTMTLEVMRKMNKLAIGGLKLVIIGKLQRICAQSRSL